MRKDIDAERSILWSEILFTCPVQERGVVILVA